MDGLIQPSMPTMPSAIQQMKDPNFGDDRRNSNFSEDEGMFAINDGKKRFSYGANAASAAGKRASRKSTTLTTEEKLIAIGSGTHGSRVHLSAKQKGDIAKAFEAFDVHGTGYMSTTDLRVALRALGFDTKKHEMKKLLEIYDRGNTGRLCYADFMTIIEMKLGEDDTREDIMKAFNHFDKDNVGRIAFHNLRQVADELGEDVNDEEIAEMLAEADLDDDGTLDQEEFLKIMKKTAMY